MTRESGRRDLGSENNKPQKSISPPISIVIGRWKPENVRVNWENKRGNKILSKIKTEIKLEAN